MSWKYWNIEYKIVRFIIEKRFELICENYHVRKTVSKAIKFVVVIDRKLIEFSDNWTDKRINLL